KNFSYRVLERIEHLNYKKANLILGQSEEILTHIKILFPNKETFLYRNYPDFGIPAISPPIETAPGKIKMVYAGLLGIAQGILRLCQELDYEHIELHIYGSGAEQVNIENYIEAHPELPISYHGEVTREVLHQVL